MIVAERGPSASSHSMHRDGIKRGIVTLCLGGGKGIALTLQALH